jgi:hypothetical protein
VVWGRIYRVYQKEVPWSYVHNTVTACSDVICKSAGKFYTDITMQVGCHPVAVVQYAFTHKQYTERHKTIT